MKKVIISGVNGQDGSYMAEYLLANTDYEILGGIRRTSKENLVNLGNCVGHPRFRLVPLELTDAHSITALIRSESPDYFINFGASTFVVDSWNQPAYTMEANATSLVHLLEAIRAFTPRCRLYSSGSSEQWGDVKYSPQDEKHPMSPRSIYGVSKCAAELICKVYRESYGIHVVHGILLNHESPRRQAHFLSKKVTLGVSKIVKALKNKQPFSPIQLGNIHAQRDWSHAADFVLGIWSMLNQEKPETYVLSSNETHTVKEFVEIAFREANIEGYWAGSGLDEKYLLANYLFDVCDIKSNVLVEINPEFFRPAEVELLLGDSTNAREKLGWKPKYSFQDLVKEMVENDIHENSLS